MAKGRATNGAGSVYKTEKGWRGSILLNGRRRYASGKNKTEVTEKLRQLKRQADEGFVQSGRSPKLKDWIEHWLDATAPLADPAESKRAKRHSFKTDENYRDVVRLYLPDWLGNIMLSKLLPDHLEDAYSDLAAKKLAQSTIYKLHSVIRASLTLAVKRGHVPQNAAKNLISPPQPTASKKMEAFSRADQRAIRTALVESRSRTRWEIALTLGARPGEVLGLEWQHMDFEERSILIEQQVQMIDGTLTLVPYTKNATSRRKIPMPEFIAGLLLEHRESQLLERGAVGDKWVDWSPDGRAHAFVFTSRAKPGRPITPSGDRTQWKRILTSAGLPESAPYRARHTAASEMIAAGLDLTVIAEILGHANTTILQEVYAHAIEERKLAAATVLDLAFASTHSIDALIDAPNEKEPRT